MCEFAKPNSHCEKQNSGNREPEREKSCPEEVKECEREREAEASSPFELREDGNSVGEDGASRRCLYFNGVRLPCLSF